MAQESRKVREEHTKNIKLPCGCKVTIKIDVKCAPKAADDGGEDAGAMRVMKAVSDPPTGESPGSVDIQITIG
jgi:hypothetical protein